MRVGWEWCTRLPLWDARWPLGFSPLTCSRPTSGNRMLRNLSRREWMVACAQAGECESPCSMPNVSRWPRCESFSPPATLSASPELAAGRYMAWSSAPCVPSSTCGCRRKTRASVRRYLAKISGRSLPQITRLIRQYRHSGAVRVSPPQRRRFPRRYTPNDIALLAARRRRPRRALGAGGASHLAAGIHRLQQGRLSTVSLDLGVPHLQLAAEGGLSSTPRSSHQDPRPRGVDRRAAQARSARPARLLAGRHGASGRHRDAPGPLPHQRCRYGHAVAGRGLLRDDLGSPF